MSNRPEATALIADDEALLRSFLKRRLNELWPELSVRGEAADGEQALAGIEQLRPDVVFLDIRMPGPNGLEVARRVPQNCHLVFVTAYDEYAVAAFERAAVDYVLKPVSEERLAATVGRLKERLEYRWPQRLSEVVERIGDALQSPPEYLRWLKVARQESVTLLPVEEVDYFQASEKYVSVYRAGDEHIISKSIKELEVSLDPNAFWRIHRSTIVRLQAIEKVQQHEISGALMLKVKGYSSPLKVSRSFSHRFKRD